MNDFNLRRYTAKYVQSTQFYQLPKFLFIGECRKLSSDAKLLYAILKERHELSLNNGWCNENGEVYIIFTRKEMCEILGKTEKTVIKAINQLIDLGLMQEEEQLEVNKPKKIFLQYVEQEYIDNLIKQQQTILDKFAKEEEEKRKKKQEKKNSSRIRVRRSTPNPLVAANSSIELVEKTSLNPKINTESPKLTNSTNIGDADVNSKNQVNSKKIGNYTDCIKEDKIVENEVKSKKQENRPINTENPKLSVLENLQNAVLENFQYAVLENFQSNNTNNNNTNNNNTIDDDGQGGCTYKGKLNSEGELNLECEKGLAGKNICSTENSVLDIDYEYLKNMYPSCKDQLELIHKIITEVTTTDRPMLLGEHGAITTVEARTKFLQLTTDHIAYVLDCIKTVKNKIYNIRAYLITSLCNSVDTYRASVEQEFLSDTANGMFDDRTAFFQRKTSSN